jgi:hypothetical protein
VDSPEAAVFSREVVNAFSPLQYDMTKIVQVDDVHLNGDYVQRNRGC